MQALEIILVTAGTITAVTVIITIIEKIKEG